MKILYSGRTQEDGFKKHYFSLETNRSRHMSTTKMEKKKEAKSYTDRFGNFRIKKSPNPRTAEKRTRSVPRTQEEPPKAKETKQATQKPFQPQHGPKDLDPNRAKNKAFEKIKKKKKQTPQPLHKRSITHRIAGLPWGATATTTTSGGGDVADVAERHALLGRGGARCRLPSSSSSLPHRGSLRRRRRHRGRRRRAAGGG